MENKIDFEAELTGEEFLRADGLDDACIGWTNSWNGSARPARLVYDISLVFEVLQDQGATLEEAIEDFEYNIAGAYVGESTPIFINKF